MCVCVGGEGEGGGGAGERVTYYLLLYANNCFIKSSMFWLCVYLIVRNFGNFFTLTSFV